MAKARKKETRKKSIPIKKKNLNKMQDLNNLYILYAWTKVSKKVRNQTIDGISNPCLADLCRCFRNIIKGKVPLTEHQLSALQRYKKELRALSSRRLTREKQKTFLKKKGLLKLLQKTMTGRKGKSSVKEMMLISIDDYNNLKKQSEKKK